MATLFTIFPTAFHTVTDGLCWIAQSYSSASKDITSNPDVREIICTVYAFSENIAEYLATQLEHEQKATLNLRLSCKEGFYPMHLINEDIVMIMFSFLSPRDACMMQSTSKFMRGSFIAGLQPYWNFQYAKRFCPKIGSTSINLYVQFLEAHNAELEAEIRHTLSCYDSYMAMATYGRAYSKGIIGMLCDLVYFDDDRVGKVLSKKRYMAMRTIITETQADVSSFQRYTRTLKAFPKSFLPLANTHRDLIDQSQDAERGPSNYLRSVEYPGFLGYVVELVRLPPNHEYLRNSVIWSLFREMMVFETAESLMSYRSQLHAEAAREFWGVALDDYTTDKLQNVHPHFRARIPRDLSAYSTVPDMRIHQMQRRVEHCERSLAFIRYSLV